MKQFPPRKNNDKFDVCHCGHLSHKHNMIRDTSSKRFLEYNECGKCMCPRYKKETEMTLDEYFKYQDSLPLSQDGNQGDKQE